MAKLTGIPVFIIILVALAASTRAQTPATAPATQASTDGAITDAQLGQSLRRAADFLLASKVGNNWERNPNWQSDKRPQPAGETAMALWALLKIGQVLDDPRLSANAPELAPAIDWLLAREPQTVFATAAEIQVLAVLPAKAEYRRPMERLQRALLDSQLDDGGFSYGIAKSPFPETDKRAPAKLVHGTWDTVDSSYGLLGVLAAADTDDPTEPGLRDFWETSEKLWQSHQNADGGWGFSASRNLSQPGFGAAAVASLYALALLDPQTMKVSGKASGGELDLGLAYVAANPPSNDCEDLYWIAQIGRVSGLRQFGTADWVRAGAATLARQQGDGSWPGPSPTVATAYAALFLTEGLEPPAFSRLVLSNDRPAVARAAESSNLARSLRQTFEAPLGWRQVALTDDLADISAAPILLIEASDDPHLSDGDVAKLRAFCQAGGLIFSTGPGSALADTMGKYAAEMAPNHQPFRKLPPDHPLLLINGKTGRPPTLFGVSNGVRELWVHAPVDWAAIWLKGGTGSADAWRVPANLLRYVTGGTPWLRPPLTASPAPSTQPALTIGVARIRYAGNWDPEPLAWPRLAKIAANRVHMDLQIIAATPEELDVRKEPLAHLTGTEACAVTKDQQGALKAYVDRGGTLFIDAAAANPQFIASMQTLIADMYPDARLELIPLNSAIYNGSIPRSIKADRITYRAFARKDSDDRSPRLQGVQLNGRYAIIFSADDVTSGLLGIDTWGIAGYAPLSAQALSRDVILYADARQPGK